MMRGRGDAAWRRLLHVVPGIAACTAAALLAAAAPAQSFDSAPEHSIKAAYLYNFAAYVDWPGHSFEEPGEPLVIGILGDDHLATELENITRDRQVRGRPVAVRRMRAKDPISGLHVLFVAGTLADDLPELVEQARRESVLVVSEAGGALSAGSIINFMVIDRRVRFEVSLDAADASGLTISSRLLAVAEHVLPRSGE